MRTEKLVELAYGIKEKRVYEGGKLVEIRKIYPPTTHALQVANMKVIPGVAGGN